TGGGPSHRQAPGAQQPERSIHAGRQEGGGAAARSGSAALAPPGFHLAHIRLIDALYALGRFKDVAAAVAEAEVKDSSFRFLPEYKAIQQALKKQKLAV
ncbi:hypothetical protein COO60DRAFT_1515701, partial [Scenedesmus sp. NREL 46B-D3]